MRQLIRRCAGYGMAEALDSFDRVVHQCTMLLRLRSVRQKRFGVSHAFCLKRVVFHQFFEYCQVTCDKIKSGERPWSTASTRYCF
jgi:hypothetical protein